MKIAVLGAIMIANTACAVTPPSEPEVPVHNGGGSCSERAGASLIGRAADASVGSEAQRLTGARTMRWIRPGDMVTMDYSPGRLNIHLDARNRVQRLSCG